MATKSSVKTAELVNSDTQLYSVPGKGGTGNSDIGIDGTPTVGGKKLSNFLLPPNLINFAKVALEVGGIVVIGWIGIWIYNFGGLTEALKGLEKRIDGIEVRMDKRMDKIDTRLDVVNDKFGNINVSSQIQPTASP